jgi:fermentation-respiration switch protein FrsA (DUF1100 family)
MRARAAVAVFATLLLAGCTHLFFYPMRELVQTPQRLGLAYEDVEFRAQDGVKLHGWFLPAQGRALGTVLFAHGNAENISTHIASVAWMPARGFNVFLFDYRGFGASEGTPSLEGAQRDIDAALRTVLARGDVDKERVVVFGQSLGGALTAYFVAHTPLRASVRALVIESAFSDYTEIAREKLAASWLTWLFQWLAFVAVDNRFSPLPSMQDISPIPLLVIHGKEDRIVPPVHARRLYNAAREPKELWLVPGAGHIQATHLAAERERLTAYLRKVLAEPR